MGINNVHIHKVSTSLLDHKETWLLTLTLQAIFLRANLLKEEIGIGFHDEQQRSKLIDEVINSYILNENIV